jgi:cell wall-associated NlpC family hydrolase
MPTEIEWRTAIVVAARSWIGTPYHNCADVKGAGVDCGMLLVRVFVDLGLAPPFDPRPYAPDWHLHRSEEKYLGFVFAHGREVEAPQPGDIAVFRFGRCYSHGGIVAKPDPLTIVHAFAPARMALEETVARNARLSQPERAPRFFDILAARP